MFKTVASSQLSYSASQSNILNQSIVKQSLVCIRYLSSSIQIHFQIEYQPWNGCFLASFTAALGPKSVALNAQAKSVFRECLGSGVAKHVVLIQTARPLSHSLESLSGSLIIPEQRKIRSRVSLLFWKCACVPELA